MKQPFHADFHGFVIDSEQGLSFAGQPINLPPKELKLLQILVKRAGKRVSKEELISYVWNKAAISDESISRCLSMVKSALRLASPGAEALIKTEYGQGYRFIGQVGKPASFVNEENFFLLINASHNLVTLKDGLGRWQIANNAVLALYGLTGKPWQGKTDSELATLCAEGYQAYFLDCIQSDEQAWRSRQALQINEVALPVADNNPTIRYFDITKTPLFEADGCRRALVFFAQDITDRLESERQIKLTSRVLANSNEAVLICDASNNIVYVNETFTRITGYTLTDVFSKNPRLLSAGRHDQEFYQEMWREIVEAGTWHGEIWDMRKNGEIYPKWLNISCVQDNDGSVCNYIGVFTDISKRKTDEALMVFLAYHDALTGLPNRLLLRERFEQAQGMIDRRNEGMAALLFLDIDQFKSVNDNLGHEAGDQLLIEVAHRLTGCVREIDTVSRLGGDEFVIVLADVPDSTAVSLVAQKVLDCINVAMEIDQHRLIASASIGIALYPNDGENFDSLLKVADTAMYHAKNGGRNTYRFFTDKMNVSAMERLRMRNSLADALKNEEFVLHFQPQFDLQSGELLCFEALIRWRQANGSLLFPNKFIAIAEQTGQMVPIGEWVIREACRQAKDWQLQGYQPVRVAVNLSSLQFKRSDVIKVISELAGEQMLDPRYLELELTEAVLLHDVENALEVIEKLKSLRFTLSIDNFGSGYSCLAYLKRFRVDKLKIDHSFIRNLEVDQHDRVIVRTIIQLANGFGLRVIAEGVETQAQLDILRGEGCHEAQGYLFSHPLPAEQAIKYLKKDEYTAAVFR